VTTRQRRVVMAGSALTILAVLVPPVVYRNDRATPAGWKFISSVVLQISPYQVNLPVLFCELVLVAAVITMLVLDDMD